MKCYICLTDSIVNRKDYFNMLKVTLISARKNTSLRLICLYDGKIGDPVYNLLKDFKVEIIIHELPYKEGTNGNIFSRMDGNRTRKRYRI